MTRRERRWLDAQHSAWLSVWEVESVEPGHRIALRDCLTGVRRKVLEARASKQLTTGQHILARIVDFEKHSYLCGMHPHALTPPMAAGLVDEIRSQLRTGDAIGPGSLRRLRSAALLADLWSHTIEVKMARARPSHGLLNPEGDPLVVTIDRFSYAIRNRDAVTAAILRLPGIEPEDDDTAFVLRGDSIVSTLVFSRHGLTVESNSLHRGNSTRQRIEKACGGLLHFKHRDFALGLEP